MRRVAIIPMGKMITITTRTKYILAIYLTGLCVLAGSLWWFRFVWLTTYSSQAYSDHNASFIASENPASHVLAQALHQPLIVHFIDRACPCTKFSLPYIEQMQTTYAAPAKHITIERGVPAGDIDSAIMALSTSVPASPAVAIWDEQGQLRYFGPYSTGAYCGDGEDMVEYVMKAFTRGDAVHWLNQEAQGCMCEW